MMHLYLISDSFVLLKVIEDFSKSVTENYKCNIEFSNSTSRYRLKRTESTVSNRYLYTKFIATLYTKMFVNR